MSNIRELEILDMLNSKEGVSYQEIEKKYKITNRSARYILSNINYYLKLSNCDLIEKRQKRFHIQEKSYKKIYEIIKSSHTMSISEREKIEKLIMFFKKEGLNITKLSNELSVSRTTIKSDLKNIEKEYSKNNLSLEYIKNKGYKINGEYNNILIQKVKLISEIMESGINKSKTTPVSKCFHSYFPQKNIKIITKIILEIKKNLSINIDSKSYDNVIAYILVLLNSEYDKNEKKKIDSQKFLNRTKEYKVIKDVLEKQLETNIIDDEIIIQITNLMMGLSINELSEKFLENWLNEEFLLRKMINKVSKLIKKNLRNDETLYDFLLYHLKPSIYRIQNKIEVNNPVFRELIISKDEILDVVKEAVGEIENTFNIEFSKDEIALLGYHFKASIERNKIPEIKKVILVCGLGYGSSRLLEQSLKENYNFDIVDILPYYQMNEIVPNLKNIDLILTTIDLKEEYGIPIVKINPLLKEEDFLKLSKYNVQKNDNKIRISDLLEVVRDLYSNVSEAELIEKVKEKFGNRIIYDVSVKKSLIHNVISNKNVKIIKEVKDWKEAIRKGGMILLDNGIIKKGYIENMIALAEEYNGYIVIEEGLAFPHGKISDQVLDSGISILIVKKAVPFPNGKSANVFISFATKDKNSYLEILSELFNLITNHNLTEELKSKNSFEEVKNYFKSIYI